MTTLKLYIRFILSLNKLNQKGQVPIRCRITFNKQRKDFSTGLSVRPEYWNTKKQKLLDGADQEEFINIQLSLIKNKINKAFLMLQIQEDYSMDYTKTNHISITGS